MRLERVSSELSIISGDGFVFGERQDSERSSNVLSKVSYIPSAKCLVTHLARQGETVLFNKISVSRGFLEFLAQLAKLDKVVTIFIPSNIAEPRLRKKTIQCL